MKKTAIVGSDPTLWERILRPLLNERGEVGDKGEEESDPPPDESNSPPDDKGVVTDSPTDNVPWDKDPRWKAFREKEKGIDEFMKANDFESIEQVIEHVNEGKSLKGKLSGKNLDDLLAKAETLESYQEYWAKQEEEKKRLDELPDDTIKRLEDKLKEEKRRNDDVDRRQKEAVEAQKAVKAYEKEVSSILKEKVTSDEAKFIKEHFGIGNPLNDLDINDMKAVNKMVEDGLKKKEAYDQAVIKKYLDGKTAIPNIPSGDTSVPPATEVKNMKEARKIFGEQMKNLFKG